MNPFIDLRFPLRGDTIPADHAYQLYAAISTLCPELHQEEDARKSALKDASAPAAVGIHTVTGQLIGGRRLRLNRSSALAFRLPSDQIGTLIALAGKTLRIGSDSIMTGVPQIEVLQPASSLRSRLICIKGAVTPNLILEKAARDITAMGITSPDLQFIIPPPLNSAPRDGGQGRRILIEPTEQNGSSVMDHPVRRTLRINGKEIIGFPLQVSGLSASDSILLQERGLGGRRHFGCGIFTSINSTGL